MYRIRPDRLLKDMNLCNAELEEVVDLLKVARARVIRCYGEGMQGLDPELSNHEKVAKKAGWKDAWWVVEAKAKPATKAKAVMPMLALPAPPQLALQDLHPPSPRQPKRRRRAAVRSMGTKLGDWELEYE